MHPYPQLHTPIFPQNFVNMTKPTCRAFPPTQLSSAVARLVCQPLIPRGFAQQFSFIVRAYLASFGLNSSIRDVSW